MTIGISWDFLYDLNRVHLGTYMFVLPLYIYIF